MLGAATVIDDELPVASHLLGDDAREVLEAGVAAVGGTLLDSERSQVLYRPGRSITVRFDATVRWGDGVATPETLLAGADADGAPDGTLPLRAGDLEVGLWRYPYDPLLVGLPDAVTPSAARHLVEPLIGALHRLTVRSYRPGRRAVVHAEGERGAVFFKVVPPGDATAELVALHRRVASVAPVPEVITADGQRGIVVLEAIPGERLRERLHGGRGPLPGHRTVDELLTRFAEAGPFGHASPRHAPVDAVALHARLLAHVLPSARGVVDDLVARIGAPPPVAARERRGMHGDLHDGQLLVDGARIVGVLDLDDVGDGDPLDDWANHLGHMSALGDGVPRQHAFDSWRAGDRIAGREVDRADVARRAAAVVLGLATGPFRVQQPGWQSHVRHRLALAERWLDEANRRRP